MLYLLNIIIIIISSCTSFSTVLASIVLCLWKVLVCLQDLPLASPLCRFERILQALSTPFLFASKRERLTRWKELGCWFRSGLTFRSTSLFYAFVGIISHPICLLLSEKSDLPYFRPKQCWSFSESRSWVRASICWHYQSCYRRSSQKPEELQWSPYNKLWL